jgi:hypothetical protein
VGRRAKVGKSAPACNDYILAPNRSRNHPDNEAALNVTSVTFLWYGVRAGGGHSYPSPAFTGWDGCHTRPASLQRFVILVQRRFLVQGWVDGIIFVAL